MMTVFTSNQGLSLNIYDRPENIPNRGLSIIIGAARLEVLRFISRRYAFASGFFNAHFITAFTFLSPHN